MESTLLASGSQHWEQGGPSPQTLRDESSTQSIGAHRYDGDVAICKVMTTEKEPDHYYSVGSSIILETRAGEVIKGEVFAHDKTSKCLILSEPVEASSKCSLRVLKVDFIKDVVSVKVPKDFVAAKLPHVDFSKCLDREAKAVQAAELEAARKGLGVTEEAQQIFDALSKTMPCKWQGKTIVVLGEVSIKEPYDLLSVSTAHPDDGAAIVERVKKVLDAERKRMI